MEREKTEEETRKSYIFPCSQSFSRNMRSMEALASNRGRMEGCSAHQATKMHSMPIMTQGTAAFSSGVRGAAVS